jgi:hypothetical protein
MLTRIRRNRNFTLHCWREYKLVESLWKAVWKVLKKLKMELPYDSVIPLLGSIQRNVNQDTIETPVY